jgi:hypothetical protein
MDGFRAAVLALIDRQLRSALAVERAIAIM